MKLKYYMRGIGIGILVTALILSISYLNHKKMSDDEVKARARELGMVESSSLLEAAGKDADSTGEGKTEVIDSDSGSVEVTEVKDTPTPEPTKETTPTPEPTEKATPTPEPTKEATPTPTATPTPEVKETETKEAQNTEDPGAIGKETPATGSSSKVTVVVHSGDSSVTVARSVQEAGLIANADDFDLFLCQNGYDKRIHVGTYEIPYDLTYAEMAKIFVGE